MPPQPKPLAERFWPKVSKSDGCWLWTASATHASTKRNPMDYGQIAEGRKGGRILAAHRASWELAYGPIPAGASVLHTCDTPLCVRPDHLRLGTLADNNRDMAGKGRANHKLTADQVRDARRRHAAGESYLSIAKTMGVRHQAITYAVTRRTWSWLD